MRATMALTVLAFGLSVLAPLPSPAKPPDKKSAASPGPVSRAEIGRLERLPAPVAEMRMAILAAARTGNLDELLIPIQWNELPPDFGPLPVRETLAEWKKNSPDSSGREMLARLMELLEAPFAVVRRGADIENNQVYVWPYFAEAPLHALTPPLHVELLRLVTAADVERMKKVGGYDGYALAIGADGTWHAFRQVPPLPVRAKTR